jgi:membrane protease subunit (stomatin/prohibitin family)
MALIDVVKSVSNDNEFIIKFPSEDLKLGTQVVVNTSQTAFFVKGGMIFDQFESGTHTLKTENIPLLNKLINLPFGGNTPFQAEIWFVNLISRLDIKWGTPIPIQIEDPKYKVIVPVRAFGQYGFKISNPRLFLETLVGNMTLFTADKINNYFKGKVIASLTSLITTQMITNNISILEINAQLEQLSDYISERLKPDFEKFGVQIINFYFISINVPENDPSIIRLKEAKDLAAKINIIGRDIYQMDRSFGVFDKAAQNEGGVAANLMGAGLGLGAGLNVGTQMGNIVSNINTSNFNPPPPISQYHVLINNIQTGPLDFNQIKNYIESGIINGDNLAWKQGMASWEPLKNQAEMVNLFFSTPPPPPPPRTTNIT